LEEIKTRLDFAYPYKGLSLIPAKVSVSELKGRRSEDDNSEKLIKATEKYSKPQFLLDDKLSAASVGIALHRFMQYAAFENLNTIEEINQQINNSILTEAEAKSMKAEEILKFIQSPLCQRLIKSKNTVKEYRFTTEISASEYTNENIFEDETILLQGVIDCFFEEEDGIVLLDYKTDFVKNENILIERYRLQLDYYARAIEELYGIRVKQKYIYSFTLGKEIEII
jgi:ATP-dependent helicase/nuclease subunit A